MEDEEEDEASLRDVEPEGIVTVQRQWRFIRDSRRANNSFTFKLEKKNHLGKF
ncbi:MAG: hypothetical protein ACK51L_02470 [bacterium]|jgi:hypothetical protein